MVLEVCLPNTIPIVFIDCYIDHHLGMSPKPLQPLNSWPDITDNNEIYLVGDFILDNSCQNSPTHNKLKMLEKTYHLKKVIKTPTRVTSNSQSIIDNIYSNSKLIMNCGTINLNTSDHFPCFIIRKKTKLPRYRISFTCRKITHLDTEFLPNRLKELDWRPFYESVNPDIA